MGSEGARLARRIALAGQPPKVTRLDGVACREIGASRMVSGAWVVEEKRRPWWEKPLGRAGNCRIGVLVGVDPEGRAGAIALDIRAADAEGEVKKALGALVLDCDMADAVAKAILGRVPVEGEELPGDCAWRVLRLLPGLPVSRD